MISPKKRKLLVGAEERAWGPFGALLAVFYGVGSGGPFFDPLLGTDPGVFVVNKSKYFRQLKKGENPAKVTMYRTYYCTVCMF